MQQYTAPLLSPVLAHALALLVSLGNKKLK